MSYKRTIFFAAMIFFVLFTVSFYAEAGCRAASDENDKEPFLAFAISPNTTLVKPDFVDNQILDGLTEDQRKTLLSIRLIDGTTTYFMKYYGSYVPEGFEELLGPQPQTSGPPLSCSTFSATTPDGEPIFAYNNDNAGADWMMIIFTAPPDGLAGMCITSTRFCGIRQYAENPNDLALRDFLLTAPHYSFDGINEFGVTMSPMNNGDGQTVYDPSKSSLHGLTTIRLVLHLAKDVHEAIALLRRFNNTFSNQIHYLLSDAYGNSAVIEYYNGDVVVTWKSGPFQVCTNNRVDGYQNNESHWMVTCGRYWTLLQQLRNRNGVVSEEGAFGLLAIVAPHPTALSSSVRTVWSSVYNNITGEWRLCLDRNYNEVYRFSMPMVTDIAVNKTAVLTKAQELKVGRKIRLKAKIKNVGIRQSAATKIDFYLSKKAKITNKSVLLSSSELTALAAGKTKKVGTSTLLPQGIKPGNYYIIADLDPDNDNNDHNYENNIGVSKKFVIKVT
jgi:hypothetical protein